MIRAMEKDRVADHPVNSTHDVEKPIEPSPRSSGGQEQATPAAPPRPVSLGEQEAPSYPLMWRLVRWLLVASAILVVGWLLWNARSALSPFAMGLVLAYLFLPIVNALDRHMPRPLAILIVYVVVIALVIGAIAFVVPPVVVQIQQLIASIPSVDQLQGVITHLLQQYQSHVPEVIRQPINEGLDNALRDAQAHLTLYIQQVGLFLLGQIFQLLNVVSFLVGFLIVPIWLFYVLNDVGRGRPFLDRLLHPRLRADFWIIWDIVNRVLGDFVRGQIVLAVSVGMMVGAGLLILELVGFRVSYVLLLTIFAGVTELVPFIGPWLGAIPGVLLGLIVSPQTALAVGIVYVVVQQIEINFLRARIIGESVGIHPAILMVILIAMGYSFGLLGIIMAAPISAIARDLFIYVHRRLDGIPASEAGVHLTIIPQKNHR
jgi:predicted PurR-regulated permease PerM